MSFSGDMNNALNNISSTIQKGSKEAIKALCTKIIDDTPVGNKEEWISTNAAMMRERVSTPDEFMPGYVPGTLVNSWHAGIGETIPMSLNIREPNTGGQTSLADVDKMVESAIGTMAWFANPTPYANRIEYGSHSMQAPNGMVRINVAIFRDLVKAAVNGAK